MKKRIVSISVIGLVVIGILAYLVLSPKSYAGQYVAMDTLIDINISGKKPKDAAVKIMDKVYNFESSNSMYRTNSYVSKINENAGKNFVEVPENTYNIIKRAYELCKESNGKFDITIAPLVSIWDIKNQNPKIPDVTPELLSLIDYNGIKFNDDNRSIMLEKQGQQIDLGGLAKGRVCDEIREVLSQTEIKDAIVSVGGNVLLYGDNTYKVGIKHPRQKESLIANVKLSGKTVSTTGDYERYFEIGDTRYHHIFDKTTGHPYESDFYSVTVISEDGMLGDYLSTHLFMTQKEQLALLIEALNTNLDKADYDVIAFGKDNKIYATKGLEIEVLDKNFSMYSGS